MKNYQLPFYPSAAQCAYLAGLVDGDGYIGVRRRDKPATTGDRRRNISFIVLLKIGGEPQHITALREEWCRIGSIHTRKRPSQRHLAEWTIASNQARRVLEAIEPYLKLKHPQAQLAIAMPQPVSRWGVTQTLRDAQESARIAISNSNSRTGRGKAIEYGDV